jgi:hypothetical protein
MTDSTRAAKAANGVVNVGRLTITSHTKSAATAFCCVCAIR